MRTCRLNLSLPGKTSLQWQGNFIGWHLVFDLKRGGRSMSEMILNGIAMNRMSCYRDGESA
ncbi:hypothetical protein SAMN06265222_110207 [Neorhodopirellula lusitana]|uniref:Uncharacterized protein n=1 Tax=Neorhodopirellula lusitana TaxID=445327 RepID=A0ABY1QFG4_9BACT|nr:hypothetical protein SAMN06265222_110207 [Neorhodopirellula lusitana]